MKNRPSIFTLLVFLGALILILAYGCGKEKDDPDTVRDIDGNVYSTVTIGTQMWMKENLRTTRYNDGKSIPTGHTNDQWKNLTTDAYAIYPHTEIDGLNSDDEVMEAYGALYNWYAVNNGKLCPVGWHVPTDAELTALINFAGGVDNAGPGLNSTRTAPGAHPRWEVTNPGASDQYGFSSLPGGNRDYYSGTYGNLGYCNYLWSSTEESGVDVALGWLLMNDRDNVHRTPYIKKDGFSVRCIKD